MMVAAAPGSETAAFSAAAADRTRPEWPPAGGTPCASPKPPLDPQEPAQKSAENQRFRPGVAYYGYRWYDPSTGRWPSRDPIEEEGGINLYGFVNNNGVNAWDLLGMVVSPGEGVDVRAIGEAAKTVCKKGCDVWKSLKPIRTFNLSTKVIKMQIKGMEMNIRQMSLQKAAIMLMVENRRKCEEARKKIEEETGVKCEGCCVTDIGFRMSHKAGRYWFGLGSYYPPTGMVVSIDWFYGNFYPQPCEKADIPDTASPAEWHVQISDKFNMK